MKTKKQLEKEIEDLKKGVSFWATKISPKMKKRKVKVNFKFKDEFIKNKKLELTATLTQTNKIIEMIEELEDEDSGDIILFKKSLLTKIKGDGE